MSSDSYMTRRGNTIEVSFLDFRKGWPSARRLAETQLTVGEFLIERGSDGASFAFEVAQPDVLTSTQLANVYATRPAVFPDGTRFLVILPGAKQA